MSFSGLARVVLPVFFFLASGLPASAHLTYAGRDFGSYAGGVFRTRTIANQTVTTNYGWADGTDDNWASSHYQTYFKFTLTSAATITLSVTSANPANFLPGYSIYSGLGQTAPPDQDEDGITVNYLLSLPAPVREGAFDALHTWRMGNENDESFSDMSVFTYMGNAADGTPANYGEAAGIFGDGTADGFVSRTFTLPAGAYTLVVGGASFFNQTNGANHTFSTTLTIVPEPGSALLLCSAAPVLGLLRLRPRGRAQRESKY